MMGRGQDPPLEGGHRGGQAPEEGQAQGGQGRAHSQREQCPEGKLSRRAQVLVSLVIDLDSKGALQEMLDKHPSAEPPWTPEEAPESAPITVNSEEVGEAVKSFRPAQPLASVGNT